MVNNYLTYTENLYKLNKDNPGIKALATIKAGYKYEIWVYSDKKVRVETKVYG